MILVLSGDIELDAGLVNKYQIIHESVKVFKNKGPHFLRLNVTAFYIK